MSNLIVIAALGDRILTAAIKKRFRELPVEQIFIAPWDLSLPPFDILPYLEHRMMRAIARGQPRAMFVECVGSPRHHRPPFLMFLGHLAERLSETILPFGGPPPNTVRFLLVLDSKHDFEYVTSHYPKVLRANGRSTIQAILCHANDPKSIDKLINAITSDVLDQTPYDDDVKTVFLSYRRAESTDVAGRIYERLTDFLGVGAVFKDVNSITAGLLVLAYVLTDDIPDANIPAEAEGLVRP